MDANGITAIVAVVIAVSALSTAIVTARRSEQISEQVLETVTQIDHAVNGREPDSETMGEQVQTATAVLPLVRQIAVDVKDLKPPTG